MTTTLVIAGEVAQELKRVLTVPLETAGVLRTVVVEAPNGDLKILARGFDWVGDQDYLKRGHDHLSIASTGYVPSLGKAEDRRETPLWFHTHPGDGSSPRPSRHDLKVDSEIADLFRMRSGARHYGTLIASPSGSTLSFTGTLQENAERVVPIDFVWNIEDRWTLTPAADRPLEHPIEIFDRNVRAFGGGVQAALGQLTVGIVGASGTGSPSAEQLVRLGVRKFVLIDPKGLTASNVTRVYGSTYQDVDRPKVEVLRDHLRRIAEGVEVEIAQGAITSQDVARKLASCHVVFGCTDDNAGRLVLSRLASYMMIPVIDVGVLLSSSADGKLRGIDGRVTVLTSGAACLTCRNRIDLRRAAAEVMEEAERERLVAEGYAPQLGGIEPAVVTFTTSVAAAAVSELLERLIGYGDEPRPTEILLRMHDREISTNIAAPRRGHYCDPTAGKIGFGNSEPWLEQVWQR